MQQQVFAIYDTKALMYNLPFFQRSQSSAIRTFTDMANDPKSIINRHPQDFVLYYLGTFDDASGEFDQLSNPEHIGAASSFLVASADKDQLQLLDDDA